MVDPEVQLLIDAAARFDPPNVRFDGDQVVKPTLEVHHTGHPSGFDLSAGICFLYIDKFGSAAKGLVIDALRTTGELINVNNHNVDLRYADLLLGPTGRLVVRPADANPDSRFTVYQGSNIPAVKLIQFLTGTSDMLQSINSAAVKILWVDYLGQLHWVDSQSNEFVFVDPNPHPVVNGLLSWGFPPNSASGTAHMTEGTVYLQKFYLNKPATLSSLMFNVTNSANSPSAGYGGLYDLSGTRLAVSANTASAFTTTGGKTLPFSVAYVANTGYYYSALLCAAGPGQGPDLSAGTASSSVTNINLTAATLRYCTGPTGQTTLPASITMSSNIAAVSLWTGIK